MREEKKIHMMERTPANPTVIYVNVHTPSEVEIIPAIRGNMAVRSDRSICLLNLATNIPEPRLPAAPLRQGLDTALMILTKHATHSKAILTMCVSSGKTIVARVRVDGKTGPNKSPITLVKNALAALEFTNQISSCMIKPKTTSSIIPSRERQGRCSKLTERYLD